MPISPVFMNIGASVAKRDWNNKTSDPLQKRKSVAAEFTTKMPWLKDKVIQAALAELRGLVFEPSDVRYLSNMGVHVPFKSGKEAVELIENNNIRIVFDKTNEKGIHAQYDFSKNLVVINEAYKDTKDFSVVLAVSEAILHEAGHAKDFDDDSSIQEELDFLGMNAVAHRAFLKKYGNLFSDSGAPIIKDGVSVYAQLFFEPDPEKQSLIMRLRTKYGDLPAGDRVHPPGKLARAIKATQ